MMGEYIISCCSTADLSKEHFERRDIHYICFHFEIAGKSYVDDLGASISFEEFYKKMEEGADTKTSQVNAEEYEEYFEQFLKAGKDVFHLALSSGISGTVNSAYIAKANLEERFPDRKIYVVDSLAASSGFGLLMDKIADLRDAGMPLDELYAWVEANKLKLRHWFFTTDLTYLIKGGRVSKTAGLVGSVLNICPIFDVNSEGKLISRSKIRTKRKVIQAIVDRMEETAEGGLDYSGKCYICNAACYEDARAVADLVEAHFPKLDGKVLINDIGTTIGSHTGPGTVALFFWGTERAE